MSINFAEARALREQRAAAHAVAVSVLAQKTLTAESRATYERAFAEVDRLGKRINEIENAAGPGGHHWTPSDPKREMAFCRYIRHGQEVLSGDEQRMLETRDGVVEGDRCWLARRHLQRVGLLCAHRVRASHRASDKMVLSLSRRRCLHGN